MVLSFFFHVLYRYLQLWRFLSETKLAHIKFSFSKKYSYHKAPNRRLSRLQRVLMSPTLSDISLTGLLIHIVFKKYFGEFYNINIRFHGSKMS